MISRRIRPSRTGGQLGGNDLEVPIHHSARNDRERLIVRKLLGD